MLLADLDVDRIHDHAGAERSPEDDQRFDPVVGEQEIRSPARTPSLARKFAKRRVSASKLAEGDSRALVGALDEDLVRAAARVLLEKGVDVREGT